MALAPERQRADVAAGADHYGWRVAIGQPLGDGLGDGLWTEVASSRCSTRTQAGRDRLGEQLAPGLGASPTATSCLYYTSVFGAINASGGVRARVRMRGPAAGPTEYPATCAAHATTSRGVEKTSVWC